MITIFILKKDRLMKYLLLALATLAASGKSIVCKKIGNDTRNVRQVMFFNSNIYLFASLIILICFSAKIKSFFEISAFSFWFSLVFAAFLLLTQMLQIYSMSSGFASLTSLIFSCGFLIPIFFSALFLDEPLSVWQIIGIAILLLSLAVVLKPSKDGSFSVAWLILAVGSMLSSGITAVIQKIHQNSDFKEELAPFVFYALLFSAVFSFILSFLIKGSGEARRTEIYKSKSVLLLMLADGIIVGGLNYANLSLAGAIPAVIHFPVYNVLSMILTAIAGRVFFGEMIGRRRLIGFGIGLAAITVIGLL